MSLEITTTSSKLFERNSLDIVGPLPMSLSGNKFILTLQDDLTKFLQAYPIQNHEAKTIADIFVKKFVCIFGTPDKILTDQGAEFQSNLFKKCQNFFALKPFALIKQLLIT